MTEKSTLDEYNEIVKKEAMELYDVSIDGSYYKMFCKGCGAWVQTCKDDGFFCKIFPMRSVTKRSSIECLKCGRIHAR